MVTIYTNNGTVIHTPYSMVLQIKHADILRAMSKMSVSIICNNRIRNLLFHYAIFRSHFLLFYSMSNFKPGCYSGICWTKTLSMALFSLPNLFNTSKHKL